MHVSICCLVRGGNVVETMTQVDMLVAGKGTAPVAEAASKIEGVNTVYHAESEVSFPLLAPVRRCSAAAGAGSQTRGGSMIDRPWDTRWQRIWLL